MQIVNSKLKTNINNFSIKCILVTPDKTRKIKKTTRKTTLLNLKSCKKLRDSFNKNFQIIGLIGFTWIYTVRSCTPNKFDVIEIRFSLCISYINVIFFSAFDSDQDSDMLNLRISDDDDDIRIGGNHLF